MITKLQKHHLKTLTKSRSIGGPSVEHNCDVDSLDIRQVFSSASLSLITSLESQVLFCLRVIFSRFSRSTSLLPILSFTYFSGYFKFAGVLKMFYPTMQYGDQKYHTPEVELGISGNAEYVPSFTSSDAQKHFPHNLVPKRMAI